MAGPSSIIGALAVRISRLGADGTPSFNNPTGGFLLCGGISKFEHGFDINNGQDIFEKDAAGNACVVWRQPDLTKNANFKLTMCRTDYRLNEILGISDAITDGGTNIIGHAVKSNAGCGGVAAPTPVSLEIWSHQWDCNVPLGNAPYQRAILPQCTLAPAGFARENAGALPVFNGICSANNNWGDGPFGDADVLTGHTNWCYAEIDQAALPVCAPTIGYINVPGSAS